MINESRRDGSFSQVYQSQRPFISWDGEGITYSDSKQQAYVLLACSTGEYIRAKEGACLSTRECFDFTTQIEHQFPNAIHVGFGFGYDTNQMLNSFSRREIGGLSFAVKKGYTYKWADSRIRIHPGKLLRLTVEKDGRRDTITIYDSISFFQQSFLEVVKGFFPDRANQISHGKSNRSNFSYTDIREITRYCLKENQLLVAIMDNLRNCFKARGLYLRDWYGPGAVANASLVKHNIRACMGDIPKDVSHASQLAYQGGRFELLRAGYHPGKIWSYDINSAYPASIVKLPNLSRGIWESTKTFEPETFGVWHIKYRDRRTEREDQYHQYRAQPFFYRNPDGRIAYTPYIDGWYWTPEVENQILFNWEHDFEVIDGWVFRPETDDKPFEYVRDIYYERNEYKKIDSPLQLALRLEINSYYGKFAQRSGWFKPGDKIPGYHCLEWAGYITSDTRAKLFREYLAAPASIFAFETDSIFSTRPLGTTCGENLGEWKLTEFDDILYLQSGFYFGHRSDGKLIEHYRGFDKGSLSFDKVFSWLDEVIPWSYPAPKCFGTSKRFVGFKRALMSKNMHYWRTWDQSPREISIGGEGKRIHMPGCPMCRDGYKYTEGLHGQVCSLPGGTSSPHKIPWEEDIWIENQWAQEKYIEGFDGYET